MPKRAALDSKDVFLSQLREWRDAAGVSQIELSERLGWRQSDISKVERGVRRLDVLELRAWIAGLEGSFPDFVLELDQRLESRAPLRSGWPMHGGKARG